MSAAPLTKPEAEQFFEAVKWENAKGSVLGYYKVFPLTQGSPTFLGMGVLEQNDDYQAIEVEYMLLPQYWNRGYGTALLRALIGLAVSFQSNCVLIAILDPQNTYSKRMLCHAGEKQYLNAENDPVELYRRPGSAEAQNLLS
ncbi:MAG: GNAT family N-acetyltransferase [Eubacteriales bacterium]|nr:GNAT family N-acetyltransferase [Clostridium sp.]MDY6082026.1 GNAT family N-acetyltransferase [Eubacteriales bacterium]